MGSLKRERFAGLGRKEDLKRLKNFILFVGDRWRQTSSRG